jgi:sugar (pentulose or hexulose) kinase
MTERYVLALDLGSSGLRAHAVSTHGSWAIAEGASRPYRTLRPRGGDGLWRQLGADDLRAKLPAMLAEALKNVRIPPSSVEAISVTAQRGGTAFLDRAGSTIYLGPNTDLRAVFEGAAIDERSGSEVYATTGHLPSMFFTPSKLHWWREHHPRTARRIAKAATLGAWVVRELTGELAETGSTLVEAGLADISDGAPATALLTKLGIDGGLLPALLE